MPNRAANDLFSQTKEEVEGGREGERERGRERRTKTQKQNETKRGSETTTE